MDVIMTADAHANVIYEFELISTQTGKPTIHIREGPKAPFLDDNTLKLDILEKLNNKWEDIGDLDPVLQNSIQSIRPKFQKILTILIAIDVVLCVVLVILVETVLSQYESIIHYSFLALIVVGVIQTMAILFYIYRAMKRHTENMNQWRTLFNNQMTYYVENILAPTYTHINTSYAIHMHQAGHKLYVVLSLTQGNSVSEKSSILDFKQVSAHCSLKETYSKPLLHHDYNA
eukprot:393784_1